MSKQVFTPYPALPPEVCTLPLSGGVPPERIGVDMQRVQTLAGLSGFLMEQTTIGSTNGQITEEGVGIAGHDGSGGAFAAMAATARKAKTVTPTVGPPPGSREYYYHPRPLQLQLNSAEIADRVQKQSKLVRDPEPWAKHINKALKRGLHEAAWRNLVLRWPCDLEAVLCLAGLTCGSAIYLGTSSPAGEAVGLFYAVACINAKPLVNIKAGARANEAPFSIVPFVHPDRAATASLAIAASKLVTVLPE